VYYHKDRAISDYVKERMNNGDDRCNDDKKWKDAELRGSIGCDAANRVIKHIDEMKSWR
jgi:hypothetical protein